MPTETTMKPAEIAQGIQSAWANYLTRQWRPQQAHPYVYASGYRICDRRLVYEMTVPDQRPAWMPETLAKFRRGTDRERDLLLDLGRIGRDSSPAFEVINQQERFELRDRKGRPAIVGKVDARLQVNGVRCPIEIKTWSPTLVDHIETFADLFNSPWTRSGGMQLLSYLYGAGEAFGFLLIDRSGLPLLLPVELYEHLDRVEEFLTRAERALDHVAAGTLPDFLEGEPDECRRCDFFGHTCQPPLTAGSAQLLTDPELEAALERWYSMKPAGQEWSALDRDLKDKLRGVESGIAGKFQIIGKWGKQSRVELPEDLKKTYTVTNPKGRFTLEIIRL